MERTAMPPDEVDTLLTRHGVPMSASVICCEIDETVDAARRLGGFPVVVKAGGLLHKSDDGGVRLGITDEATLRQAASELAAIGDHAWPLIVQPQHEGFEMLAGIVHEPALGAAVVVGVGGVHAEVFADVARGLVPLGRDRARKMLEELRAWPLLAGHRGQAGVDLEALLDVLMSLSGLADAQPEVVELDLNPLLVGSAGAGAVAVDARIATAPPAAGRDTETSGLDRLLRPKSVAVVGVSDDAVKAGTRVYRSLRRHGFQGQLDAVHPDGGEIDGHPRAAYLGDLGHVPDLVCAAVPSTALPEVVETAGRLGVGAVLVHSAGFAETGEDGLVRQRELAQRARAHGSRLAGPNSMGVVSPAIGLAASLGGSMRMTTRSGTIALVSSSGALGSCLASRLWERGSGISRWISVGNEADIDAADYLSWLADDDETQVIGLLLEHITDGRRLARSAARALSAGKPVFAYTMARTSSGQEAAKSHTGALVGSHALRELVLRSAGVSTVPTLQALEDSLRLAEGGILPGGPRLGVVSASGGVCSIIGDLASSAGLELPALPPASQAAIAETLPSFAAAQNPIDVTVQVLSDPSLFAAALDAVVDAGCYDAVLVQLTTNADPGAEQIAKVVVAAYEGDGLPLVVSRYGAAALAPRALATYAANRIPILDTPDRAIDALRATVTAGVALRQARP
jgi:acyl-CoA synthetase (NDP forming)